MPRQSVYMNDCHQVNAQTLEAPFGGFVGDLIWPSIKRRDKEPVHDWLRISAHRGRHFRLIVDGISA